MSENMLTSDGSSFGTTRWAAPELIQAQQTQTLVQFTPGLDVYSFGVVMWEVRLPLALSRYHTQLASLSKSALTATHSVVVSAINWCRRLLQEGLCHSSSSVSTLKWKWQSFRAKGQPSQRCVESMGVAVDSSVSQKICFQWAVEMSERA